MRAALALGLLLALGLPGIAGPARLLGPGSFGGCVARAESVHVALGPFRLRLPFSDFRGLRTAADPGETLGCDAPITADEILISTPDGFRGSLVYRAATVNSGDAGRVRETLQSFAARPGCDDRGSVRVCRIRASAAAPVTTFVFAKDPALALASGAPAYLRCSPGPALTELCKIQDLVPAGYEYRASVAYSEDGPAIAALHRLATAKWQRFTRGTDAGPLR